MTEPRRISTFRLPTNRSRRFAAGAIALGALLLAMPFAAAQEPGADPTAPPAILGFEPTMGPPGTAVVVTGENFDDEGQVYLGGLLAESEYADPGSLSFTVPDMGAMEANLQVYNDYGGATVCCFTVTEEEEEPAATTAPEPGLGGGGTSCTEREKNVQCNTLGRIAMDAQRDIRGDRIDLTADITLNTAFADRDARWVLFSVRNVTDGENSPVTLSVTKFETAHGPVVTTDVKTRSNEVNMWVHVIDVPVNTPITIGMNVGASERGAYRLETLVMVFDRGYAPIKDSQGQDASLFSFTLLGVNEETAGSGGSGKLTGLNKVPGFEAVLALTAVAAVAVAIARRRSA